MSENQDMTPAAPAEPVTPAGPEDMKVYNAIADGYFRDAKKAPAAPALLTDEQIIAFDRAALDGDASTGGFELRFGRAVEAAAHKQYAAALAELRLQPATAEAAARHEARDAEDARRQARALQQQVAERDQRIAELELRLGDPRDIPADTGDSESDRLIGRLTAADPEFDDCTDAAVLIREQAARIAALEAEQTAAARDVLAERARQVSAEGWTPEHDDQHAHDELVNAAACYALTYPGQSVPCGWPWADEWWKPSTPRRNLIKACALLLAEIERRDRADAARTGAKP